MKALRVAIIAAGCWFIARVLAQGEGCSRLAKKLSATPQAGLTTLVVIVICLWGVIRLLRRHAGEEDT